MPDMNENAETQQEYFGKAKLETDYKDLSMRLYKRIADLEKENAELHKSITDFQNREATLESQIAELKEKVNILDNCDRLGDMITEAYKDQLTKAKELLKQLVDIEYAINIPKEKIISLRVKAEQFLKDSKQEE